jgi:hypothetical protein
VCKKKGEGSVARWWNMHRSRLLSLAQAGLGRLGRREPESDQAPARGVADRPGQEILGSAMHEGSRPRSANTRSRGECARP